MSQEDALIKVNIFGVLSVTVDDRTLGPKDLGGVKPRQLLEMLVLQRRAVSKEEMVESLWARRQPLDPNATLETYISVLRNALQPGVNRNDSLIATVPGGYECVRDRATIDIDRFDEVLRAVSSADGAERRVLLGEAASIASGSLLANEPYAEWVQAERRHYDRLRLEVLVAAADTCVVDGDGATALDLVERAIEADSSCEIAYLAGMRAAGLLGRRDLVARLYQQCERSLRAELGVAPMHHTTELRDELLQTDRRLVGAGATAAMVREADVCDLGSCRWPSTLFG